MSGLLYFLPGQNPPVAKTLADRGFELAELAGAFQSRGPGPDDQIGYVFELKKPPHPAGRHPRGLQYAPDDQTWYECADGAFWLGWFNDDPPTPFDLQRRREITGTPIETVDGQIWQIPALRREDGTPRLRCVVGIDRSGRLTFDEPAPPYAALWALVRRCVQRMQGGLGECLTNEDAFELYTTAMSFNYRVSMWELGFLKLIEVSAMVPTILAVLNLPTSWAPRTDGPFNDEALEEVDNAEA